jgi:hypothetical protein
MNDMQICCPRPYPKAVILTIQVSLHCYQRISYAGNSEIHEDLGISYFAELIRALTENFDSKLTDAGNPYFQANWEEPVPTSGCLKSPR